MRKKPINYLSNKLILPEIHASKSSYCWFQSSSDYHEIVTDLPATAEPGTVVRLMTEEHIPEEHRKKGRRSTLNFHPFKHFLYSDYGWQEVGRSHWKGTLGEGYFSFNHGRLTRTLAQQITLLSTRYATRPNFSGYSYRDDLQSEAIVQLCHKVLKFDESKSDNPFAYMTTITHHAFIKILNAEKSQHNIRDTVLISMGHEPSFGFNHREEATS